MTNSEKIIIKSALLQHLSGRKIKDNSNNKVSLYVFEVDSLYDFVVDMFQKGEKYGRRQASIKAKKLINKL